MIVGAIPYRSFREQRHIIENLKRKYRKINIKIVDDIILYELFEGKLIDGTVVYT
ncbi:hypothetical protein AB1283_00815 [Bacillus sp. S13(2024)]|uniref:hypothetical protein n=1 Tax=Bacillus sp. S13(2024) TaxID=3162885 RepID=UPI003D244D94